MCRTFWNVLALMVAGSLTACGGGGDAGDAGGQPPPPATYSVGGSLSGATGTVTLANNGNALNVTANGSFTFSAKLTSGSAYAVTVTAAPAGQSCQVTNGSGTVIAGDVANVAVTCASLTYTVSGAVGGVGAGKSVTLHLTSDAVSANLTLFVTGHFDFPQQLQDHVPFVVEVSTQPAGQTCQVTNGQGNINGANITNVAVVCIDSVASARTWSTPASITTLTDYPAGQVLIADPEIAFDANGNGLAVWEYNRVAPNDSRAYWSRYTTAGGWTVAAPFPDHLDNSEQRKPKLAMAPNGNAIVVWTSKVGQPKNAEASFYTPAGGWSTPEWIDIDASGGGPGSTAVDWNVVDLRIVMDSAGNVLLVWEKDLTNANEISNGTPAVLSRNIAYNRYTPGAGWSFSSTDHGQNLTTNNNISGQLLERGAEIAMNANGEVVAVWQEVNLAVTPIVRKIWSSRYTMSGGTWSTPVDLGGNDSGQPNNWRSVVLDNTGVATALWSDYDGGTHFHIMYSRTAGGVWSTPAVVETLNDGPHGQARQPCAVINAAGVITAVWIQRDDDAGHYVSNRYVPGTGWGIQKNIGEYVKWSFNADETEITLANNAAGDVVALWTLPAGIGEENVILPADVWANEYNAATGEWGAGKVIGGTLGPSQIYEFGASNAALAIKPNGDAVAVWQQTTAGPTDPAGIYTSRFE
jgi:hypothetical protein